MLSSLEEAYKLYQPMLGSDSTISQFRGEYIVWSNMWKNFEGDLPKSAIHTLNHCPSNSLPNIHKLLYILATLPVSNAEVEREFSKVKRTLTALRATMSEERLEALIMIETFREMLPTTEEIIDKFSLCKERRKNFGLKI